MTEVASNAGMSAAIGTTQSSWRTVAAGILLNIVAIAQLIDSSPSCLLRLVMALG